jgi:hypothetical protein
MKETPKEGMRVHVYSADIKKDLGVGTIEKVEPLRIEERGLTITSTYPSRIVLDSGEVTEGLDCWWIPIDSEKKILKRKK